MRKENNRMDMDDISQLVSLIESTKDDATKSILRKLLQTEVAKRGMIDVMQFSMNKYGSN